MVKTIRKGKSRQKIYVMKGCSKRRPKGSRPKTVRRPKTSSRKNKKSVKRTKTFARQKGLMRKHSLQRGIRQSIGLSGGNCTTCLQGGSSTNALIGAPWSATDGQTQPTSNHYAQNMYKEDPQMMMQVRGGQGTKGRRGNRRRRGLKGGSGLMSLVPADLLNLGRDLTYNVTSAHSAITGATPPVDPNVTEGQLKSSVNLNKIVV